MKVIAIILSIFTFALSVIPCDDEGAFATEQLTSISQSSDHNSHNDIDVCTPFCSCVCCASIVLEPNLHQDNLISDISKKELNTFYDISFSSDFLSRIYQPPQV